MKSEGNVIKFNVEIEIPIEEIGETLICDDSESFPLCGYGYIIQEELYKILGWTKKISDGLEAEAFEEIDDEQCKKVVEDELEYDTYYQKWIEKAQEWVEEKLKQLKDKRREKYKELKIEFGNEEK